MRYQGWDIKDGISRIGINISRMPKKERQKGLIIGGMRSFSVKMGAKS